MKINILSILFVLSLLCGCSADEDMTDLLQTPSGTEQAQVVLSISVPEVSLPLSNTRAIEDDKAIDNLAVWAFDADNNFLYQLTSSDMDSNGKPKIVQRGSNIYMLLPKSEAKVTLGLIANCPGIAEPVKGTSKAEVLQNLTFGYSTGMGYVPMYGESTPFIIAEGAKAGTVRLTRALAKLEVIVDDVLDNFELTAVTVVNSNTGGTVARMGNITNTGGRDNFRTASSNGKCNWVGYIPEAANIDKEGTTRVSLVLEGYNKKNSDYNTLRYYRLDFIQHDQTSTTVKYDYITSIERNKHYTFKIHYMAPDLGSYSFDDAVSKKYPDNHFFNSGLMTIDDDEIRDITTDDQYYLGVTSREITAEMRPGGDNKYYTANMSIVTNNPYGWSIEDLPSGVEVSKATFSPGGYTDETATSVWVYINKENYEVGGEVVLYVYCGHFRKTVRISIIKNE